MTRRSKPLRSKPQDSVSPQGSPMIRTLAICGCLVLMTVVAYWQVGQLDFVTYDDPDYASKNFHVEQGLKWDSVCWAWTTGETGNWHPLTWLSLMLDSTVVGNKNIAACHHGVNLAFHVVNVLLLFLVLQWMTGAAWRSAFVAALFAVHPLHVESVAWISERKDVLSTFFGLLALGAYVWFSRRPNIWRYALVFVALALGLMAKPMLVTWPLLLLVLDYWPLERLDRSNWLLRLVEKLPLLALSIASSVVTFHMQHQSGAVSTLDAIPFDARIGNAMVAYVSYIGKMFWPLDLAPIYPLTGMPSPSSIALAASLLLAISGLVAWGTLRGRRYLAVGWLWYLGTLVPVIGLVQVGKQSMADRYTYIPLIGLFLAIAWGVADLTSSWRRQRVILAITATAVLGLCIGLTVRQVSFWGNTETLFKHTREVIGPHPVICDNLAVFYSNKGDLQEAMAQWKEAYRIDPADEDALNGIAVLLIREKRFDDADKHLEAAIRRYQPKRADAYNTLAGIRLTQGRVDEAVQLCEESLRRNPNDPTNQKNLAKAYLLQGKVDLETQHWREAVRLAPNDIAALDGLGTVLLQQGQFEEAATMLQRSLEVYPDDPVPAHNKLGAALAGQGKWPEAMEQWNTALRLAPKDARTINSLAWALSTCPISSLRDGRRAVSLAQQATKLFGENEPTALDTLAAAYAEAGQFPEAVKAAERAVNLASAQNQKALADRLRTRLELYRKGTPYREAQ